MRVLPLSRPSVPVSTRADIHQPTGGPCWSVHDSVRAAGNCVVVRIRVAQVLRERLADLHPRSVQQDSLVRIRDLEQLAHLVSRPPLYVAQRDHLLLPWREGEDRCVDVGPELVGKDLFIGSERLG